MKLLPLRVVLASMVISCGVRAQPESDPAKKEEPVRLEKLEVTGSLGAFHAPSPSVIQQIRDYIAAKKQPKQTVPGLPPAELLSIGQIAPACAVKPGIAEPGDHSATAISALVNVPEQPGAQPTVVYLAAPQDPEVKALRAAYLQFLQKWLERYSAAELAALAAPPPAGRPTAEEEATAALEKEYVAFLQAWLRNNREILAENRAVLLAHNTTGRYIGWGVHAVVLMSVAAAGYEFVQAQRLRKRARQAQQEISIGLDGIALKTSRQSMIFLALSLMLYFAYLRLVFPIFSVG